MRALLAALAWPAWRAHPWRQAAALLAVALGVALSFAVQLINGSALDEFAGATRAAEGTPDLQLRAAAGGGTGFDEALYGTVARTPGIAAASPVVEGEVEATGADGRPFTLRLVGLDALAAVAVAPHLLPQPADAAGPDGRLAAIDPSRVFLNTAARARLGPAPTLRLASLSGAPALQVAGSVAADGPPLAVVDIAGAQVLLGKLGRLGRIDLRLSPGTTPAQAVAALHLPPGVQAERPGDEGARMADLSRAYRVNLTVLALVALFTGAFLVFSVMALSVAQRVPQFALLGVLGLGARERMRLVLAEAAVLGAAGSAIGLALGTALALAALRLLGGDLGGGYFEGLAPRLHWQTGAALANAALGFAATLAGAWLPARQAAQLAPAQALKGLGLDEARPAPRWLGPAAMAAAAGLALMPPIDGLPVAAYLSVGLLLLGGIACVPMAVGLFTAVLPAPRGAMALLALQRARVQRGQAAVAVSGVVAALSLGVALTVMVGSFRGAVDTWLLQLLPADLYVRPVTGFDRPLPAMLAARAEALPGVTRVAPQRTLAVSLAPRRPAVLLVARPLPEDPGRGLPLVGPLADADASLPSGYASEALASLYGARPGTRLVLPVGPHGLAVRVRGIWRDYADQHGALLVDLADYRRTTGDLAANGLAVWVRPGAMAGVETALRAAAGPQAPLELATTAQLHAMSLRLFDRSFAVTTWLQAVAIGIGLFGVATSFSAQVLARRKEFGMLAHLGVTRREVLAMVAAEGALWTGAGALLGLLLGLAVSVVLVDVVNPQSFHWTMDIAVPWLRLAALCAAVVAAGTVTAALAARGAGGRAAVLAVKEDW